MKMKYWIKIVVLPLLEDCRTLRNYFRKICHSSFVPFDKNRSLQFIDDNWLKESDIVRVVQWKVIFSKNIFRTNLIDKRLREFHFWRAPYANLLVISVSICRSRSRRRWSSTHCCTIRRDWSRRRWDCASSWATTTSGAARWGWSAWPP